MPPRVSVIITAYNGAAFLATHSLPSVLAQSYGDFELIVVDDGSTDATSSVVRAFAERDARVRYVRTENRGLAAAMNRGLAESRGEIVAFLEQDDAWLRDKLAKQVALLDAGRLMVGCLTFRYDLARRELYAIDGGNFSTLAARRETWRLFYPLDEDRAFSGIEDGLLAAEQALAEADGRIVPSRDYGVVDEPLVIFAISDQSLSGRKDPVIMARRYRAVLDRYAPRHSPALRTLMKMWRRHYWYNRVMTVLPAPARLLVYGALRRRTLRRQMRQFPALRHHPHYQEAVTLCETFSGSPLSSPGR